MSYSIGGAVISDMEFTRSWGLSPGSASITAVGASGLVAGGDYVLTIGADSFYGVLTQFVDETEDGTRTRISFVDVRVKLMRDTVFGLFNRVEVREDNPATPGIDRQKRYLHILPNNWLRQVKTYTEQPLTAQQIIQYCLDADSVNHSWSPSFDAAQNSPVHEIDANTGKKLGNILQEVSDAQGLLFTLEGQDTLHWARKGVGSTPGYDPGSTSDISNGEAVSTNDTKVTMVGDRNRYQDTEIDLEPDWNAAYEDLWLEPDWQAALSGILGLDPHDFTQSPELAARMRTFTVRELVAAWGPGYVDYGMWGEVARTEIPVWTYLHDIVFKAYRVPLTYVLDTEAGQFPRDSLELIEGLLSAINYDLGGGMTEDASQLYPDAKAFLIMKGQPLGLVDPTKQRVLTQEELDRESTEYSANNRFNLDVRNKTVIFQDAVFVSTDLVIFPNKDITGVPASLKAIAVPNPDANIGDANVRAALVWDADRYLKLFGSGERQGSQYVPGLGEHVLADGTEISYADGEFADDKATAIAASLIAQQEFYASGGFTRNGASGTALTGAIDRVTVRVAFETAITERVEYSKERSQSNFEAERDLERKQRAKDLFPGQRKLKDESKELDLIAKVSKELKRSPLKPVYGSLAEFFEKPVGAPDCSVAKINTEDEWLAGTPVFLGTSGRPEPSGEQFAGIVIADGTGQINCATQGIVPVRVKGPFESNDNIGIDAGAGQIAKVDGEMLLGRMVSEAYSGSETVLAMVQLGGGGGSSQTETPFQVIARNNPDSGALELGVISNSHVFNSEDRDTYEEDNSDWGLLDDDRTAGWWGDIDVGTIGDKIWLKITLDPDDQSITAIDVEHGAAWDGYPDPININTDNPDNPYQQYFYQIIAEITDPEQDPRPGVILTVPGSDPPEQIQVTQLLFANLMMTTAHTTSDADEPGVPLLVAIPWNVLPGTDEEGNADEIPSGSDIMTPWQLGTDETANDYNFELFNASEPGNAKVLILDGVVIGPNDDPVDPDGMPSDDTYTLDVADGDEIWLVIVWDLEEDDEVSGDNITSVTIDHGPSTPDDDGLTQFITIGSVSVDDSGDVPIVTCRNEVCGDVVIQYPPAQDTEDDIELRVDPDTGNIVWKITEQNSSVDFSFKLTDSSDDSGTHVDVASGWVIGPNNDVEVADTTLDISPGQEVYLTVVWSGDGTSGLDIDSATLNAGLTPDDDGLTQYVTIGAVVDDGSGGLTCGNATCGDVIFPYPPKDPAVDPETVDELFLAMDTDDGTVRWIGTCEAECGATKCGDGDGCP